MTQAREDGHLADEEIDLYGARRLPAERMRTFEEHYLECEPCRLRVEAVEDLVDGLAARASRRSRLPLLPAAAAVLAATTFGLALQNRQLRESLAATQGRPPIPARPAETPGPGASSDVPVLALAAPVRGSGLAVLRVPAGARTLVLAVDAREAAPPGALLDVTLVGPGGRARARLSGLRSSDSGQVALPLPASLLAPGDYVAELRDPDGPLTVRIPFRVD